MQSRTSGIIFTQELSSVLRLPHKDLGPGLAEGDVQQRLLPPAAHQVDGMGGRRQGQLPQTRLVILLMFFEHRDNSDLRATCGRSA